MRTLLTIATILAAIPAAHAQLGTVTGTVQDTTQLETDALDLDATSRIGSRLQTDVPTSRIEQMRQRRALREARSAAVEAREAPIMNTGSQSAVQTGVADTASAAVSNTAAASATPRQSTASAVTTSSADIAGQTAVAGQSTIVTVDPPAPRPVARVQSAAETVDDAAASIAVEVPSSSVSVPAVSASAPAVAVTSPAPRPAYVGSGGSTVIIRDRSQPAQAEPVAATPPALQPASRVTPQPVPARAANRWIDPQSISENAFSICCALLLVLTLLMAAHMLTRRRVR
ncbi:hypothetical protein [Hyphobacterium sp.]|uniref:hypothetical protein n=1 Tax=Hyphobacterium sp. TaxID=2004662 RepID=UPI003B52A9E6